MLSMPLHAVRGLSRIAWTKHSILATIGLISAGCLGHPEGTIVGVAVPVTALLAVTPTNEIEQIYYLGVFDPQEQVPSTIYRIRVHGQSSALSNMRFGSGWVKAALIDSLNTSVHFDGSTT